MATESEILKVEFKSLGEKLDYFNDNILKWIDKHEKKHDFEDIKRSKEVAEIDKRISDLLNTTSNMVTSIKLSSEKIKNISDDLDANNKKVKNAISYFVIILAAAIGGIITVAAGKFI